MRYSRAELLERVELTRRAYRDTRVSEARERQRAWEDERDQWRERVVPDLVATLRSLADKVEGGGVIGYNEVSSLHNYRFTGGNRPVDVDVDARPTPEWLEEIERVLASLTDDEVSANALDKAGVIRHVRKLVRVPVEAS